MTERNYHVVVALFVSALFIGCALFVNEVGGASVPAPPAPEGTQSKSWNFTILNTPTPGGSESTYDVSWCPGKNFSLLVGSSRTGGGGGTTRGLSYRLFNNSATFVDRKTTEPDPGTFYGVDWNPAGDRAFVVGRRNSEEYTLMSTSDGVAFTREWSLSSMGDLRDVAWNSTGTAAIMIGYEGTDFYPPPDNGHIYRVSAAAPGAPVEITPSGLTNPLFTVGWCKKFNLWLIAGTDTILWSNGVSAWDAATRISDFRVNDVSFSPDGKYAMLVGLTTSGNFTGKAMLMDLDTNMTRLFFFPTQPLNGVSWKPTGNFATISGEGNAFFEYSDGTIRLYSMGTGSMRSLRRQCWANTAYDTSAGRYEWNVIAGSGSMGGGGSGARVVKYRQKDGNNPAATDAADFQGDAQNSINAPGLQILPVGNPRGYLDIKDTSDFYQLSIPADSIIGFIMFPYLSADYGVKLYDSSKTPVKTANSGGTGAQETILYDAGGAGGTFYVEIFRVSGDGSYLLNYSLFSNAVPIISIDSPVPSNIWTGGMSHNIKLTIVGGASPYQVTVNYSTDAGSSWTTIVDKMSAGGPDVVIPWSVPKLDSDQMRLQVFVSDNNGPPMYGKAASPANFAVDSTAPGVTRLTPSNNSASVPLTQGIFVQFSEKMNNTVPAGSVVYMTPFTPGTGWAWNATKNGLVCTHAPLAPATTYKIQVNKTAKDVSETGNSMNHTYVGQFTTTSGIPPLTVQLTSPNGGENWTTGTAHDITWTASGGTPAYKVSLNYTTDAGATWTDIVKDSTAPSPFSWNVPNIPATSSNCLVGISLKDSSPLPVIVNDDSNSFFTIYKPGPSNNPQISSTDPPDGTLNVGISKTVVVIFSKPMNTSTVTFTCTPNPGGLAPSWSNSNKTLSISHTVFANSMVYTFNVTGGKDASGKSLAPGSVPNPWSFTTVAGSGGPKISSVRIAPYPLVTLSAIGAKQPFTAQAYDTNGAKLDTGVTYTWSIVGQNIGTISPSGGNQTTFNSTATGTCNVQITAAHSSGTKTNATQMVVSVTSPLVMDRVEIVPATKVSLPIGNSAQFTAYGYNGSNILPGVSFHWTISDSSLGNLTNAYTQTATFFANKKGGCELRVNATYNSKSLEATNQIAVTSTSGTDMPPSISHTPVLVCYNGKNYTITATVTDDSAVKEVRLFYRVGNKSLSMVNVLMAKGTGDQYKYTISGTNVTDDIYYYIWAQDNMDQISKSPVDVSQPYHVVLSKQEQPITPGELPQWVVFTVIAILILLVMLILLLVAFKRKKKPAAPVPGTAPGAPAKTAEPAKPVAPAQAEKPADGKKPDEKKPEEKQPEGKKPDEKKPEDMKPDEKKPDEKKPDDAKPQEKPAESVPKDSTPPDTHVKFQKPPQSEFPPPPPPPPPPA